jgi:hypothetical protein
MQVNNLRPLRRKMRACELKIIVIDRAGAFGWMAPAKLRFYKPPERRKNCVICVDSEVTCPHLGLKLSRWEPKIFT